MFACDRAYVAAMYYSMVELLFSSAQARDFEWYCQHHGADRNEVLAELLTLGLKAKGITAAASSERAKERRLAKPTEVENVS
jgi:hypothetical protein